MPDVDDTRLNDLIGRSQAEINNPVDYSPLGWSTIPTPDGTPLNDASQDTRTDYQNNMNELGDYVNIGVGEVNARQAGTAPPVVLTTQLANQWDFVIRETVADRHGLVDYLHQHFRGRIAADQASINDLQNEAARQQRAFAAVKQAIADSEYAERWTGILLKINEGYDALASLAHSEIGFDPALITIEGVNVARSQVFGTSQIIEKGVSDLGDYSVALALVSEGYAGMDDLNSSMASTMQSINSANDQLANDTQGLANVSSWDY